VRILCGPATVMEEFYLHATGHAVKAYRTEIPEPGDLHKTFFRNGGEPIRKKQEQQIRAVGLSTALLDCGDG